MDLSHLLASLGLAAVTFACTNIDDLFVLVGFLSDPAYRPRAVVLGQYLGIGTLVVSSVICALVALVIPRNYIGLFGLAPIAIGLSRLYTVWRRDSGDDPAEVSHSARAGSAKTLIVAGITVANGSDNLGIYIPMFATSTTADLTVSITVFAAMTALWCAAAHFLVRHPTLGAPIRHWGRRVLPFVLVALGVYILGKGGDLSQRQ